MTQISTIVKEKKMKKIILMCLGLMLFACDTDTKKTSLSKFDKVEEIVEVVEKKISKEEWIDYNSLVTREDCLSAGGTWTEGIEAIPSYGLEGVSVAAVEASCSAPLSD